MLIILVYGNNMILTLLTNLFSKAKQMPLGRWGYYWEQKIKYQKYYD